MHGDDVHEALYQYCDVVLGSECGQFPNISEFQNKFSNSIGISPLFMQTKQKLFDMVGIINYSRVENLKHAYM